MDLWIEMEMLHTNTNKVITSLMNKTPESPKLDDEK